MDHSEQKVSSEEVGQMNMSMNKMSVELDKVFFKVNLTLLSIQGCTSSKCQQKVEIFIGQPKSQQF